MTDQEKLPEWPFPHLIPDSVTESRMREVLDEEISARELETLIRLMWTEPECAAYLFWPTTRPLGEVLRRAIDGNRLVISLTESKWYAHPSSGFTRITKPKFDWQREAVRTTMFYRAELKLSASEIRKLDGVAQQNNFKAVMDGETTSYRIKFVNWVVRHYRKHQDAYNLVCALLGVLGLILTLVPML